MNQDTTKHDVNAQGHPAPEHPEVLQAQASEHSPSGSQDGHASNVEQDGAKKTRPPVLASESLFDDLEPFEPAEAAMRYVAIALSLMGLAGLVVLGNFGLQEIVAFCVLTAIGAAGALPLSYKWRAVLVSVLSAVLVTGPVLFIPDGVLSETPSWLTAGIGLLSTGLLFRHFYRASSFSRVLVALGLTCVVMAFLTKDSWAEWVIEDTRWQSWIPLALWCALLALVLLSLLAFMDASSTGGAAYWSIGLLAWQFVDSALRTFLVTHADVRIALISRSGATFVSASGKSPLTNVDADLVRVLVQSVGLALLALASAQVFGLVRQRILFRQGLAGTQH